MPWTASGRAIAAARQVGNAAGSVISMTSRDGSRRGGEGRQDPSSRPGPRRAGGDVDVHVDRVVVEVGERGRRRRRPGRGRSRRCDDQAGAFGDGDEDVGVDRAGDRVGPAGQGLDGDGGAVGEAHDRLVVDLEAGRAGRPPASAWASRCGRSALRAAVGASPRSGPWRPCRGALLTYMAASAGAAARRRQRLAGLGDDQADAGADADRVPVEQERFAEGGEDAVAGRSASSAGSGRAARRTRRRRAGRPGRSGRTQPAAGRAIARRTRSPMACPKLSLISLKSSRSAKSTASGGPVRGARRGHAAAVPGTAPGWPAR